MDIFEKVRKKFGLQKEVTKNKTEEIMAQREEIKLNLAVKLYQKGCSDDDIQQVLSIIQSAEDDINVIKKGLIGTNINPDENDPMKPIKEGREAIRKRQLEMEVELREAIDKILKRK
ncbi:hypothetical protein IJX73_00615 [bacterium]|nr:hypothetical protein [bacterium]MBQ9149412.1 hypothetical protein [bacterium]